MTWIEENTDSPLLSNAPEYPEEAVELLKASFAAAQDGAELDEKTRKKLKGTFGYYGELAIGLSDQSLRQELNRAAYQAAIGFAVVLLVFGTVGFAGVVGLIIMIVLAFTHKMHGKVVGGPGHGVYAETFALWLIAFFGLQILAGMTGIEPALLMAALAFFLSLSVLAWPVLRGKRWSEVCSDIGWHKERSASLFRTDVWWTGDLGDGVATHGCGAPADAHTFTHRQGGHRQRSGAKPSDPTGGDERGRMADSHALSDCVGSRSNRRRDDVPGCSLHALAWGDTKIRNMAFDSGGDHREFHDLRSDSSTGFGLHATIDGIGGRVLHWSESGEVRSLRQWLRTDFTMGW